LWDNFAESTTINGLRQPPLNKNIFDASSDISPEVSFLAKMAQVSYKQPVDRPSFIVHDNRHYYTHTHFGTMSYGAFLHLSENDRRVLYEKHETGIPSIAIYTPINVNEEISDDVLVDVPIYVVFRGTDTIWDVFKDLNLLFNYGTGSHFDSSGIQSLVSQICNYLDSEILNTFTENIVFISHSLGSKIALDVMEQFKTHIYADRFKKSIMFNPFIVVDDIYESALASDNDYKSKFEGFIIDGDFASIIYKNNPIGTLTIYGNIVPENSWIDEIQTLTRQQYLNVANHNINAFTNGTNTYPVETYVHYEPDDTQEKQITSRRKYTLTGYDTSLTNEEIFIRKRWHETEWKVGNINVDSAHLTDYNITMRLAPLGKKGMIMLNGHWSYPIEMGIKVVGTLNFDQSNLFYLQRALNEQSQQSFYLIVIENNLKKYYRTIITPDYSIALFNQDKENGANAFELEPLSELTTAIGYGPASLTYMSYRWFINNPEIPIHADYNNGTRRNLITSDISYLPIHNRYYKIKLYNLSNRYVFIRRPSYVPAVEGTVTSIYEGASWTTEVGAGDIFKVFYNETNDTYQFLDYAYFYAQSQGSGLVTSTDEVYLGESNIHSLDFSFSTGASSSTSINWTLTSATSSNTSGLSTDEPQAFLITNESDEYLYHHNAFTSIESGHADVDQSIDPLSLYTGTSPGVSGLFTFEEVLV